MMEEIQTKLKVGTSIINILSTSFYTKKRMIFDEIATNSYDAGATNVEILFENDSIKIKDNGKGMDRESLQRFFTIGDSPKKEGGELIINFRKRKTIGKFGIGKLSMRQICNRFKIITSTGDGKIHESEFNFQSIEKIRFIDDIFLEVNTTKTENLDSGTEIILLDLKQSPLSLLDEVSMGLSKTMPLSDDFSLKINNKEIEPFDYVKEYEPFEIELDEDVQDIGNVIGRLYFTKSPMRNDEVGIFIKVNGRVVNADHGRIIDFSSLTHSQYVARRILCIIEVNSLEEAILSNRSGFSIDNKKYQLFLEWIRRKVNRLGDTAWKEYKKESKKEQEDELKTRLLPSLKEIVQEISESSDEIKELSFWDELSLDVQEVGLDEPECKFDPKESKIIYNSMHPAYIMAIDLGQLKLHCLKAAAVILAIYFTQKKKDFNLVDFHDNYEHIIRKAGEGDKSVQRLLLAKEGENLEISRKQIIDKILEMFDMINRNSKKKIFDYGGSQISPLFDTCDTKESLNFSLQKLYSIFEKADTSEIEESISEENAMTEKGQKKRSIGMMEEFMLLKGYSKEDAIILRDMEKISAGLARHLNTRLEKDVTKIYKKYNIDIIDPDYGALWLTITHHLMEFLEKFCRAKNGD